MKSRFFYFIPFLAVIFSVSCINDSTGDQVIFKEMTAGEFTGKMKSMPEGSYVILDIRTPEEYSQMHIKGAINIDYYTADFKIRLDALDKDIPYFLYCRTGNRSGKALQIMKDAGFKKIYHLQSGIITDTDELLIEK